MATEGGVGRSYGAPIPSTAAAPAELPSGFSEFLQLRIVALHTWTQALGGMSAFTPHAPEGAGGWFVAHSWILG